MQINQFEIWIADLSLQIGTEPGKTRPVSHPSTIVCPLSTMVQNNSEILRVHLKKGMGNLLENCDVMIDQIRAINNKRLVKKVGELPLELRQAVKENIAIILDMK